MDERKIPKTGYLKQDFRVFRLRDEKMRDIPFHYHDFHKILFFLSGNVEYTIEGKTYPLSPRDIVFVSAGEIHRPVVSPAEPYERIVIYVSPDFLAGYRREDEDLARCFGLAAETSRVMHVPPGADHDLLFHMDKLEKAAHGEGFARALYSEILFIEFMILLNRSLIANEMETSHPAMYDEKIQQLIGYIQEHLTEPLTVDGLAEKAFVSKYHLMRRFKAETGYSIHKYINSKRLLMARSMLEKGEPITEICYSCGFRDYSTFSRAFKRMFHTAPAMLRTVGK